MSGFVAHLHPSHVDVVLPEQLQRFAGVGSQGVFHFVVGEILPSGGNRLFGRVGPPVAVVEINHDGHAIIAGAEGHGDHIVLIAETSTRIHPHAQANGIEAQLVHEGGVFAQLALSIVEALATRFQLSGAADVGTQPKRSVLARGRKSHEPEQAKKGYLFSNHRARGIVYFTLPTLMRYSAICTALRAAPLRIWSPLSQKVSPLSSARSLRTRPT